MILSLISFVLTYLVYRTDDFSDERLVFMAIFSVVGIYGLCLTWMFWSRK